VILPGWCLLGVTPPRLMSLGAVDLLIIVLYFVFVLGLGLYLKRFAGTGEEFFMAGRQMTAWIAGLSFISANLGSREMMGYAAATYQYGILNAHAYWIATIPAILFLSLAAGSSTAVAMPQLHIGIWWRQHLALGADLSDSRSASAEGRFLSLLLRLKPRIQL